MEETIRIDVIILSYAQNDDLKETTINAINSLMVSEDPEQIRFNLVVIESQKSMEPYQYPNSRTVYPDVPFGYHRYMNIGIDMTSSPFVCMCNNDLIFHPLWATELLKPLQKYTDVFSASPFCPVHHPEFGFKINDGLKLGYQIRQEIAGWCILLKRNVFLRTGKLDENYVFWYADNDYSNTLWCLKLRHVLVTSSVVEHLESKTLKEQTKERELALTENEGTYFHKKWKVRFGDGWKAIN